jgi:hypothetical protein
MATVLLMKRNRAIIKCRCLRFDEEHREFPEIDFFQQPVRSKNNDYKNDND